MTPEFFTNAVTALRVSFDAQGLADEAQAKANLAWISADGLFSAEYDADWLKYANNPATHGVIDNRHPEAFSAIRAMCARASTSDAEYERIAALCDDPIAETTDRLTAEIRVTRNGKRVTEKVEKTKKDWQSWRADKVREFLAKVKVARKGVEPRKPRVKKAAIEQLRDLMVKAERIVQKADAGAFEMDVVGFQNSLRALNKMIR
jgi:hypothetical protein